MKLHSSITQIWKIVIISLLWSNYASAVKDRDSAPVVTKDTLVGVWEAISTRDSRVIQFEFKKNGDGVLVAALPYDVFVYPLTGVKFLAKEGTQEVMMDFLRHDESAIQLKGTGWAVENNGCLTMTLDMDPLGTSNTWDLVFFKRDDDKTYVEYLYDMSIRASRIREKRSEAEESEYQKKGSADES